MPMPVTITQAEIPGVLDVRALIARDDRGYFSEVWSARTFSEAGLNEHFVQDNLSASRRGTLRGLHYQLATHGMGKLVRALRGSVFDVAVDIRRGSPSFGKWVGRTLTASEGNALWVPVGFAHGFVALEDETLVLYKCTATHAPEAERAIHYADPSLGIEWPIEPSLVSPKDAVAPRLSEAEYDFEFRQPATSS
jgi:dTDP-4-dehydrorhamnose 3,5-epimerase